MKNEYLSEICLRHGAVLVIWGSSTTCKDFKGFLNKQKSNFNCSFSLVLIACHWLTGNSKGNKRGGTGTLQDKDVNHLVMRTGSRLKKPFFLSGQWAIKVGSTEKRVIHQICARAHI